MFNLTELAICVLALIGTFITVKVIPYLHERYTREQLDYALMWGEIAVNAAEQLAKSGVIKAEERKEYAMKVLEEKGIKLDFDELSDIIEAFVAELPSLITETPETKTAAKATKAKTSKATKAATTKESAAKETK